MITEKSFPILIEMINNNNLYEFKTPDTICTVIKGDTAFVKQNTRGYNLGIIKNGRIIFKNKLNRH